jgi:tetratricopeptide (TPR) repeat protein
VDDRPLSIRARRRVKAQMEKYEREKLLALFSKRMTLARDGATFFKEGKYREALQSYYQYLDILEKTKGVKSNGLEPRLFDQKKDIAELLLLTGVFWDLAKILDKMKDGDRQRLGLYLDRYVLFSKGMAYQHLSAELVRKYLVNGTPRYRKEFKNAHIRLGGNKCFMVTAVEDYCEPNTLPTLRDFRDGFLLHRAWGRVLIRIYYRVGPSLARMVLNTPVSFQVFLAKRFDRLSGVLSRSVQDGK